MFNRRKLLKNAVKYSSALAALNLVPRSYASKIIFDEDEQKELEAKAEHIMVVGSPYANENWKLSPHMHFEFKKNIQNISKGRIFVDIKDKGVKGIGPKLMASVSRNRVSAGLVSISNLTPIAKELDVLNIPFWAADNQSYVNLVTSDVWKSVVLDKIKQNGQIEILFHYAVGPRTASTVKSYGKLIKTPLDTKGVLFRVPASKVLGNFYKLAGANPKKIAWGKTADASRKGLFEALDPGIIGLYNGPNNLKEEIAHISRIQSVHDGWAMVVSQEWLNKLPNDLKEMVFHAADNTFQEQIKRSSQITENCIKSFEASGTNVYMLTDDEKQQWIDQCGSSRKEWNPIKKEILGDLKVFDQLFEAAQTKSTHTI